MKFNAVKIEELIVKTLLWISVLATIGCLFSILFHILGRGLEVVTWEFLTAYPIDMGRRGGIFPSIMGTVYLIAVSLLFAAPVGILAAIHLTEYTRKSGLVSLIHFAIETLAGIPSIVIGIFGFAFLVIFLGFGWSILSGGLTLSVMILPTIIRTTEDALKSVPRAHRDGSLALGATKWQTLYKIVIPAALPGILTGVLLGISRAVGEAAAVFLTAGSSLNLPASIFDPARPLPLHLFLLAREGVLSAAYGTATVIILLILVINTLANLLMNKMASRAVE